ncbi:YgaP family membrane protein [Shewanella sp. 30m-9]
MSIERAIMAFAGFMVLVSLTLTVWINNNFIWLTVFVGANLFQSAYTGFCPAAMILRKFGFKSEAELATANQD